MVVVGEGDDGEQLVWRGQLVPPSGHQARAPRLARRGRDAAGRYGFGGAGRLRAPAGDDGIPPRVASDGVALFTEPAAENSGGRARRLLGNKRRRGLRICTSLRRSQTRRHGCRLFPGRAENIRRHGGTAIHDACRMAAGQKNTARPVGAVFLGCDVCQLLYVLVATPWVPQASDTRHLTCYPAQLPGALIARRTSCPVRWSISKSVTQHTSGSRSAVQRLSHPARKSRAPSPA